MDGRAIKGGHGILPRILYRDHLMAPTQVFLQDPCFFWLTSTLTGADMGSVRKWL